MKRPVLWNEKKCYAKRFGYVGVFVALFCVFLVDLLEGNHWIHKETSYGNVPDWRPEFNHQNEVRFHINLQLLYSYCLVIDHKQVFYGTLIAIVLGTQLCSELYLNTKSSKSNDCEKEGWQENLSKTYPYCDDHDHLEKRECVGHTHGDHESSPCMVKRCTIRALLTSTDELPNSYHRPTRKLVELTGPIVLIGVVVTTAVVTLGVFVLVLICCLGRDALKPAAKQQKEDNKQEKDKLVVNLSPKASKDELGHIRVPHLICLVLMLDSIGTCIANFLKCIFRKLVDTTYLFS